MQGTMVMLLALSGLGCGHSAHKAPVYDSCYSSCYGGVAYDACYDSCYSACYGGGFVQTSYGSCYSSCYGGSCYATGYDACYSSCYGGSCYGGGLFKRKHGGLFSCFGGGGGLFGHKHKRAYYDACYSACYGPTAYYDSCYSACYFSPVYTNAYDMPVFGTYTPAVSPQAGYGSPQGSILMSPSKAGVADPAPQSYGTTPTPAEEPAPPPAEEPAPPPAEEPAPATDLDTLDTELPTPPAADDFDFPAIDPNT